MLKTLPFGAPDPAARIRLFCFHHAGGSALLFQPWRRRLPGIDVLPVQLPGRWNRLSEPAWRHMPEATAGLLRELAPSLDVGPYAFFGFSLGALIAYELARRLDAEGHVLPARLFVAGRGAPQVASAHAPLHALPDAAFLAATRERYGALPQVILDDPGMREMVLGIYRADLELYETYIHRGSRPIATPITALGGEDDPIASKAELAAWSEVNAAGVALRMFPGDHFFLRSAQTAVLAMVADELGA